MRNYALYEAAKAADDAFQAKLIRIYGKKLACEKRYQTAPYHEESLNELQSVKIAADRAWLDEMHRSMG